MAIRLNERLMVEDKIIFPYQLCFKTPLNRLQEGIGVVG
jgi:hypothetical protein